MRETENYKTKNWPKVRLPFSMQIQAPRPIQVKTQLYRLYQNVQRKLGIRQHEQVVVAMTKSQKSFYRGVAEFVQEEFRIPLPMG